MSVLSRRAIRKYKNDGFRETLSAGWEIIYRKKFLKRHVSPALLQRSPYTILQRSEISEKYPTLQMDEDDTTQLKVPPKTWVPRETSFSEIDEYDIEPPFVSEIANAKLIGPAGIGLANGELIGDTIAPPSLLDNRIEVATSRIIWSHGFRWAHKALLTENNSWEGLPKLEIACPLIPLWENYYHWIVECITKIRGVEWYKEQTNRTPRLVIPPEPPSWAKESLEIMLPESIEYTEFEEQGYRTDRLVVPSYPEPTPQECNWIHRRARASIDSRDGGSDRIYISRRNATRRRIRNEDDVLETLKQFGFTPYILEDLTVTEQIKLFSGADIVVGPHGAGFTNILFADNIQVVEIFGEQMKTTFYRLAKILGFGYEYITAEGRGPDIHIDTTVLRNNIQQIISE